MPHRRLLLCLLAAAAPAAQAANAEADRALVAVQTLLDAWREADPAKAGTVLHPEFRELTLHETDGKWNLSPVTRAKLLDVMGRIEPGAWDDKLIGPTVSVDGPIAVVWSRYRFRTPHTENGVLYDDAHCGIETFQLYKLDGEWKILNFADTHADCAPGG